MVRALFQLVCLYSNRYSLFFSKTSEFRKARARERAKRNNKIKKNGTHLRGWHLASRQHQPGAAEFKDRRLFGADGKHSALAAGANESSHRK